MNISDSPEDFKKHRVFGIAGLLLGMLSVNTYYQFGTIGYFLMFIITLFTMVVLEQYYYYHKEDD